MIFVGIREWFNRKADEMDVMNAAPEARGEKADPWDPAIDALHTLQCSDFVTDEQAVHLQREIVPLLQRWRRNNRHVAT